MYNYAVFFRILVRFGLPAVTFSVAAGLDSAAFFCLLASIVCFSFSDSPLLLAALLPAFPNALAAKSVPMPLRP